MIPIKDICSEVLILENIEFMLGFVIENTKINAIDGINLSDKQKEIRKLFNTESITDNIQKMQEINRSEFSKKLEKIYEENL